VNVFLDFARKDWRSVRFHQQHHRRQSIGSEDACVGFWSATPEVICPLSFGIGRCAVVFFRGRGILTIKAARTQVNTVCRTHKELETKTKTGLMQTAAKAAEHAAEKPPLDVSNTSQLRDLAQSAARIFGWNTDGPQVQFSQLCITQEQLEQIRQLRAS
jgi:hypothetical protein